jgi:hypothetical protein
MQERLYCRFNSLKLGVNTINFKMKIFISHASANKQYGDALVALLRGVGIGEDEIIYTSNTAYGIPISQNIFKWLKTQITEKPFVIYLLSKEYYASIACMNEMGAAWVIENEHAAMFTPGFDIYCKEFQNGAIDPREIGFYLDNQERILAFIQLLQKHFTITKNQVLIHQEVTIFLKKVSEIIDQPKPTPTEIEKPTARVAVAYNTKPAEKAEAAFFKSEIPASPKMVKQIPIGVYDKFINDVLSGKLKEEELILLQYIIETGRVKLGVGWQEQNEMAKIAEWEEVDEMNNKLSVSYSKAIGKFELRGYTEVSALTGSNNPKEVKLKSEITDNILDLPETILQKINKAIEDNKVKDVDDALDF